MRSQTIFAGTLVALLACSPPPKRPDPIPRGDYTYATEYLEWRIDHVMEDLDLPGLAIAIVDDEGVIWEDTRGVTKVGGSQPITEDTVWRVGSITKLVTAFEVMRLVEEGVVDLDAPVSDYLPGFSMQRWVVRPEPVTVRHVLAHRAGIPRNSGLPPWYWDPEADLLQAQAEEVGEFYAAHPPGERFHYSNAGFDTLAALVEAQRGELWGDRVQEAFLEPLGMDDSAILSAWLPEGAVVAVGHEGSEDRTDPLEQHDIIELGSGNLYASLRDLETLAMFVLRGGDPLLDPQTLWSMYEVQYERPRDPKPMGLAWFTSERLPELLVHHTGTTQGTESALVLLPESRLGVVVVANSTRFAQEHLAIAVEALEIALETKTGTKSPPLQDAEKHPLDRDALDAFTGTWVCDDEPVEVFRKDGTLKLQYGATFRLVPVGPARFRFEHWLGDPGHIEASFFVGEPGQEDLMIVDIEELEQIYCPRYPEVTSIPPLWEEIAGHYRVRPRVESAYFEGDNLGTVDVTIEEDRRLRSGRFLIWPEDEVRLRIVGGQWDGETILRDPETGELVFQYEVDVPIR